MIKAEMFEPNDYKESPATQLCEFINSKKIKSCTVISEDTTYWCAKQQENKFGKRLVLIYEEATEDDK